MHQFFSKYSYSFFGCNSLYIPLTSRCNSLTLPETRGAKFTLPSVVVSSLCRVRDAEDSCSNEGYEAKWSQWCDWLDTQDELSKHFLPKRLDESNNRNYDVGSKPSVKELMDEVLASDISKWDDIVIAGEGEPTLRLEGLIDLVHQLHTVKMEKATGVDEDPRLYKPSIRVVTNGLVRTDDTKQLVQSIRLNISDAQCNMVDSFSVALMTHDADQYDKLMQPDYHYIAPEKKRAAHVVHDFIRACLDAGIIVEATAVSRSDVNKAATEEVAANLGITLPVRWRPYFP